MFKPDCGHNYPDKDIRGWEMTNVCEDINHSGRNSLMDMNSQVRGWYKNGQISDSDWLLWQAKFDRLKICTKLFGKPIDMAKKEGKDNEE